MDEWLLSFTINLKPISTNTVYGITGQYDTWEVTTQGLPSLIQYSVADLVTQRNGHKSLYQHLPKKL